MVDDESVRGAGDGEALWTDDDDDDQLYLLHDEFVIYCLDTGMDQRLDFLGGVLSVRERRFDLDTCHNYPPS